MLTIMSKDVPQHELKLTKIMFGAGVFSGRYNDLKDHWPLEACRRALELGINAFDTSPYYLNSESILGDALYALRTDYPRSCYYISTKIGRYGHNEFDYSAQKVRESVAESMRRLKTDYLDIVFAHDVEFVDFRQVVEALEELFALKAEGKIKYVGISGLPLDTLLRISQFQQSRGQPLDIVLSYCHYNLQDTLLREYEGEFRESGVRYLLNASPLSMGLLRPGPTPDWHPASPELREAANEAVKLCRDNGFDLSHFAMRFALAWDGADSTVIGFSNQEEVNVAFECLRQVVARERGEEMPSEEEIRVYEGVQKLLTPHHSKA